MLKLRSVTGFALVSAALAAAWAAWALSPPDEPELAFAYRVEAIVEGERIVLETSQECVTVYYGEPFQKKSKTYDNARFSIGRKLPSGRGFFAVVPRYCGWIDKSFDPPQWPAADLEAPKDIVPLLYFADDYDEPQEFLFNVAPAGYSPEHGDVELISATVRPLIGDEKNTVPQLLGEEQGPMRKGKERGIIGYVFYPVPDTYLPELGAPDFVDSTGRYEFYALVDQHIVHFLGHAPHSYFHHIGLAVDRNSGIASYVSSEAGTQRVDPNHFADPNRTVKEALYEDIPRILPLRLTEGGAWTLMPENGGWAYFYTGFESRFKLMRSAEPMLLEIGTDNAEMPYRNSRPLGAGLRDRLSGQFYHVERISLPSQNSERK